MTLTDEFQKAVELSKTISKRPSNDTLLKMYALYKQATEGDVSGTRPSMFDLKGVAKYDAWTKEKGLSAEQAMQAYIDLIQSLLN